MKPLNLAKAKIAERMFYRQQLDRRISIMALAIGIMLFVAIGSVICRVVATGKTATVQYDLAAAKVLTVDLNKQIDVLQKKMNQLEWQKYLARGSRIWIDVIDTTLACVPEKVWLKRVETAAVESSVIVDGYASNYEAYVRFADRLKQTSKFLDVRTKSTSLDSLNNKPIIGFSLNLRLKNVGEKAKASQTAQSILLPKVGETL